MAALRLSYSDYFRSSEDDRPPNDGHLQYFEASAELQLQLGSSSRTDGERQKVGSHLQSGTRVKIRVST